MKAEGPWNPGLTSTIPGRLMPKVTLYDPRNGIVGWTEARELSAITGLAPHLLATFKPERLALHHVLIRVTGELHVPDGPNYADLGTNLRSMAATIYARHVAPAMEHIAAEHERLRRAAETILTADLRQSVLSPPPTATDPHGPVARLLRRKRPPLPPSRSREERALDYVRRWADAGTTSDLATHCRRALARTLGAILNRRGALLVDEQVVIRVATNFVANSAGCDLIGTLVAPLFDEGVAALGYHRLPPQDEPLVLNAKGASAAGKSTIRAKQRLIAARNGLDWQDFAIISPDYWRKLLIDYDGLGADYKYAAMLTGQELEIIDHKLDRLLADNAAGGRVPHILVDRFRFDSFQLDSQGAGAGRLLARHGARVYLFLLVTAPAETVERAWTRGLETGRYKAVDDLLYHNVEAYSGMPGLFFYWALRERRSVHYEFLDNSTRGASPRTIAFGRDRVLVIRDLQAMCNVERFRHIDIDATEASALFSRDVSETESLAFVRRCCALLDRVDFVLPDGRTIFARAIHGRITVDPGLAPPTFPATALGDIRFVSEALGTLPPGFDAETIGEPRETG